MELTLLLAGLFLGLLTSYASTVANRGGIEHSNIIFAIIGFVAMLAIPAIVIWGFFNFSWWVPIVSFIGLSLVVGPVVGRQSWLFFFKISPLTGLITIAITGYAWFG
jgi:cell division protein FtsW (lipid II flippase)